MDKLPEGDKRLESILISSDKIQQRVEELACQIRDDYGVMTPLCIIGALKGATIFITDLVRTLSRVGKQEMTLAFLRASAYGDVVRTGDSIGMRKVNIDMLGAKITAKHILVVDDILDQGFTLSGICAKLTELYPDANIKTCVLLKKELANPSEEIKALRGSINPDYVGFKVQDRWVVGYGLDAKEMYRELPYIALADEKAFD